MEKTSFAFLAHRVESWNWLLNFKIFNHLHRKPEFHWFWLWLWPVCAIVSFVQMFSRNGFETVDDFRFAGMRSQTILLRNYAWHFLFGRMRKAIKLRILEAVLFAQKENQVIGLGALTKAEWLTQGGQWIVDKLGDKLSASLVHGDTLTAAACLKQVDALIKSRQLKTPIFITGATSKIGRAIVLTLAKNRVQVKMYTKSEERFSAIRKEAGEFESYISIATSLKKGKDCQLWLTGKSRPAGTKLLRAIPKGAVVVNFSVPNPLGENNEHPRKDILVVEGGLLAYNANDTDLHFTMRLRPGLTYACHAATAVHAYKGWTHHEVSMVDVDVLRSVWEAAMEIGFFLPTLPETVGQTTKEQKSLWKKLADVPASIIL